MKDELPPELPSCRSAARPSGGSLRDGIGRGDPNEASAAVEASAPGLTPKALAVARAAAELADLFTDQNDLLPAAECRVSTSGIVALPWTRRGRRLRITFDDGPVATYSVAPAGEQATHAREFKLDEGLPEVAAALLHEPKAPPADRTAGGQRRIRRR